MATAEYVVTNLAGNGAPGMMPQVQNMVGQPIIDVNGLSGESPDSRKRPLELDMMDEDPEMQMKRSHVHVVVADDSKYILKVLIPSTAAGCIIGKGGQTIAQLQRETGTNIKLSKNNDFYPGTTERVALLTGTVESLNLIMSIIIDKVKESPQLGLRAGAEQVTSPERAKQVKIVIPNSTAGLIIGKAGAMIKSIMEQSGSRVQISQKSEGVTLSERVITISGEDDANKKALSFIISKIQEDPQSGSCNNLSYAAVTGPVANANPTGSPFAETIPGVAGNLAVAAAAAGIGKPQVPTAIPGTGFSANPAYGAGLTVGAGLPQSMYQRIPTSMPQAGVTSNDAILSNAISQMHGYSFPGLGAMGGLPGGLGAHAASPLLGATAPFSTMLTSGILSPYQMATAIPHAATTKTAPPASSPPAILEQQILTANLAPTTSTPPVTTIPVHAAPSISPEAGIMPAAISVTPMTTSQAAFHGFANVPGAISFATDMQKDPTKETIVEVEVPESLVGAILGKSGKTLVEFQNFSGAKIQISKKGEFVPGTRNRKVTIKGSVTATHTAHYLVTHRVAQEEANRALKGTS